MKCLGDNYETCFRNIKIHAADTFCNHCLVLHPAKLLHSSTRHPSTTYVWKCFLCSLLLWILHKVHLTRNQKQRRLISIDNMGGGELQRHKIRSIWYQLNNNMRWEHSGDFCHSSTFGLELRNLKIGTTYVTTSGLLFTFYAFSLLYLMPCSIPRNCFTFHRMGHCHLVEHKSFCISCTQPVWPEWAIYWTLGHF